MFGCLPRLRLLQTWIVILALCSRRKKDTSSSEGDATVRATRGIERLKITRLHAVRTETASDSRPESLVPSRVDLPDDGEEILATVARLGRIYSHADPAGFLQLTDEQAHDAHAGDGSPRTTKPRPSRHLRLSYGNRHRP
jgi:hypothetical protein